MTWRSAGAFERARAGSRRASLIALVALRVWPHAPLQRSGSPLSTGVWSADGELLRVTLVADDQYRLWVPLAADVAGARRRVPAEGGPLVLLASAA